MFKLEAPYPAVQTTSFVPNPEFSDGEALTSEVLVQHAMDGTIYTTTKQLPTRKLTWTFQMNRNKALELRAFIQSYHSSKIKVTDHRQRVWVGHLSIGTFDFDTPTHAGPAVAPMPRGEMQSIAIEFEGEELINLIPGP